MIRLSIWMLVALCLWAGPLGWRQGEAGSVDAGYLSPPAFDLPETNYTKSGQLKVMWLVEGEPSRDSEYRFELQQSMDADFANSVTLYTGPDYATFLSGMRDGTYYYRVRLVDGSGRPLSKWSPTINMVVQHHSLFLAYVLLAVGGLVFLLTVAIVVHGSLFAEDEFLTGANG